MIMEIYGAQLMMRLLLNYSSNFVSFMYSPFTKLSDIYNGSVSIMYSDGSKKWYIIDGKLYKFITSQQFELQPTDFTITSGTCNSSGDTLYLTDDNGNIWTSINVNDAPLFAKKP